MLNKINSRLIVSLLIVGLIASTICITGSVYNSEKEFTPRLTAPLRNNTCYYSSNIFYNSGYGMPNCTAYAWGRAYEILGKRPNLSLGDAGNWYEYNAENNIYPYGENAEIGAIACFDNSDGGHVAVVEKIEDGKITFSNSAYGGNNFYLSYADIKEENPGQKGWIFQGYIYLKEINTPLLHLNSVRIVTCNHGLNLRETAGLNGKIKLTIPAKSQIFISDIYFENGYTWGKTNYNGTSGYCVVEYTASI